MAKNEATAIECSFCGGPLEDEEAENPRLDPDDGEPMCDDCYHDHCEFTCCCCAEYGETKDQHNMLVVGVLFESASRKLEGFRRGKVSVDAGESRVRRVPPQPQGGVENGSEV